MFIVGLGLMGLMWAQEWQHQAELTDAIAATTGCAVGRSCPKDQPICLTHAIFEKGVCTSACTAMAQCPDGWCCQPSAERPGESRCAPPELCRQ